MPPSSPVHRKSDIPIAKEAPAGLRASAGATLGIRGTVGTNQLIADLDKVIAPAEAKARELRGVSPPTA